MRRSLTAGLVALIVALIAQPAPAAVTTLFTAGIPADTQPAGIAVGADGNVWFTGKDAVGRVTPAGTVTVFTAGVTPGGDPTGIAPGPDGNMWFTEYSGDRVGRITPDGVVTEFAVPALSGPFDIVAGPDGNLWFTLAEADAIGRITPGGTVTTFEAGITPGAWPSDIAAGADGNLWFTEHDGDRIGRITPEGAVTEFSGITANSAAGDITAGPDGALWFVEELGKRIGRVTTGGAITEYPIPEVSTAPAGIAVGGDGALWFSQPLIGALRSVGVGGAFALRARLAPTGANPEAIVRGPDGGLWFTAPRQNAVGRYQPDPPPVPRRAPTITAGPVGPITRTTATVTATVDPGGLPTQVSVEYGLGPTALASNKMVPTTGVVGVAPATAFSRELPYLIPGTTYHYRLTASNFRGSAAATGSFRTLPGPGVVVRAVPRRVSTAREATPGRIRLAPVAAGTIRIAVQRPVPGRLSRGRCVAPTRTLLRARARACVRLHRTVGVLSKRANSSATVVLPFSGRIGRRALPPGRYRLSIDIRLASGRLTIPVTRTLTVVAR
ncbi:MAG: hypothetical protein AB7V42_14135 [Thermoleophilia bacterium]